ncbi:MAG: NAD(P)/FAD-dependent oxidoreductase [Nocardiaceae bacterium]|nr:NAD(P)/FAD-dependent oxidoreductase [Nocardiaceae bacterium]
MTTTFDVVIVGAGLSGINAAYRLQERCPDKTYAILEARDSMGGTWDLFRYPGVRSDSDIFTFGFGFKPWTGDKTLADGAEILHYLREAAHENGIDQHIRYRTKVVRADWSSRHQKWHLTLEVDGETSFVDARFLYLCCGYYRYDAGYTPDFADLGSFAGTLVHPQFWPDDLDYADKNVVIIGSGATAVTMLPAMARTARHVTMLQRSATWITPVPSRDKTADRLQSILPAKLAHSILRLRYATLRTVFYSYCRRNPEGARKLLLGLATKMLEGHEELVAEHFTPTYNPWEQRLCAAPGADFFKAIRSGDASVVSDRIDHFESDGIRLVSGAKLDADVVVTATGLQLLPAGGIDVSVDGRKVELNQTFLWRGTMVSGVPNLAICIGYTNSSWTLRSDIAAKLVCRLLRHMDRKHLTSVSAAAPDGMPRSPLFNLKSGYFQRAGDQFPAQGPIGSWRMHQNYFLDRLATRRGGFNRELQGQDAS